MAATHAGRLQMPSSSNTTKIGSKPPARGADASEQGSVVLLPHVSNAYDYVTTETTENDSPIEIPMTASMFHLHTVPPRDAEAIIEAYLEEAHT